MGTGLRGVASSASASNQTPPQDIDIDVGVAVETRNYMALVHKAEDECGLERGLELERGRGRGRQSEPIAVGLPMDTGNFAALLAAAAPPNTNANNRNRHSIAASKPSAPRPRALPCVAETGVAAAVGVLADTAMTATTTDTASTNATDEVDGAVLGLPISTGNYQAMFVQDDRQLPLRHRGYSELARDGGFQNQHQKQRGNGRLRASESNARSTYSTPSQSRHRSSESSLSRDRRGVGPSNPRETCFERRRNSAAAVPVRKGWLWLQSPNRKMWKRYYAVLSGFEFRYSKERAQAPVGFTQVQTVNAWNGKPHGLVFVCTSETETPIHAYCENDDDRDDWVQFMTQAIEKRQSFTGQSRTSYTISGADHHDGYMYRRERSQEWCRCFFSMRNDGYLACCADDRGVNDRRYSGYVQAVTFAEVHPNSLAIQLDTGVSLLVYTETYDDRMLWYAVIAAAASVSDARAPPVSPVKTTYVETARPNHSGWLYKQQGLFKVWKHVYVSLHGAEIGYAKDTNAPLDEVDCVHSVKEWEGHQYGLQICLVSGQVWRVRAESYESAKQWRNIISDTLRHADSLSVRRYLNNCKRRKKAPVFGGWLTLVTDEGRLRQFYVMDGTMLGVADDVDNCLRPIGSIVDLGAIRSVANGMLFAFADGSQLKVAGDSVDSAKAWYDCLSACL